MQLQQLKYVLEVAKTGSMNKAAQNLFISQPNLSQSIMNLEQDLNIKIFERTNKGVKLTKLGRDFIMHAKFIVNQVNTVESIYANMHKQKTFTLEVSAGKNLNLSKVLCDIYSQIEDDHIKISLNETNKQKVIEDVSMMRSEIGLIMISNLQEEFWLNVLEMNQLEFHEIAIDDIYIYVGPENKLASEKAITVDQLKGLIAVHLVEDESSALSNALEVDAIGLSPKTKVVYLNDKQTISQFIEHTDAYAFGFKWGSIEDWQHIHCIPFEHNEIKFKIGWIKRRRESLSDEAELFLRAAIHYIQHKTSVI